MSVIVKTYFAVNITPNASALKNPKVKRDLCHGSWHMQFDFLFDTKNTRS